MCTMSFPITSASESESRMYAHYQSTDTIQSVYKYRPTMTITGMPQTELQNNTFRVAYLPARASGPRRASTWRIMATNWPTHPSTRVTNPTAAEGRLLTRSVACYDDKGRWFLVQWCPNMRRGRYITTCRSSATRFITGSVCRWAWDISDKLVCLKAFYWFIMGFCLLYSYLSVYMWC